MLYMVILFTISTLTINNLDITCFLFFTENVYLWENCNETKNYLSSSTLALGGTFNDTRQVKELYVGTMVFYYSRDACQCCELITGSFRVCVGQGW